MNKLSNLLVAIAFLAGGACDAKKGIPAAASGPVGSVRAPNGDWSQVTTVTPSGGFLLGNPNAKVKLIEYGSMTCPHCAEFDKIGATPLTQKFVRAGKVSWEFRNFVRDPFDIAASLIARCNGARSFFGLTRSLYSSQREWVTKLQAVPQSQMEALQNMSPEQQFVAIGKLTAFPQFAAMRGVPVAKANACLANQAEVNKLVQMNSDAVSQYNIPGTPSFILNGALLAETATWDALEPKLKSAVGS